MGAFTIPSVFTARDKFSVVTRKMGKSVKKFAAKAEVAVARASRAFRKLGAPIRSANRLLGGFGAAIGGALIITAVSGAISIFADFEQANANLSSVMATATIPQLEALEKDAIRLGSSTAKSATEVVGLQEALARLGFAGPDIINMTESIIAGSIAMNSELSETANLTGAMVRTFDAFSSSDAPMIMDQMTAATQKSALSFEKLNTALPIVSGAANAAGIPFTKLMALLGKLSDAGIDASSSSTALRNIFLDSAKQGLSYEQILAKIEKEQNKLTAANDEFGKRGAISAVILAKNMEGVKALDLALQGAAGTADEAAKKQLNTLNGALTILGSSYEGFILNMEKGNPVISDTLKTIVKVATEFLSFASGTQKATDQLDKNELKIRSITLRAIFWLKVIGLIIAALIVFKIGLLAATLALGVYNFAIGAGIFIMKAITVAQWLWNAAMLANPIGLIIIGVAALIGLIALIINKWNSWGAALAIFMGPLGFIISLIQSFRRNWDMIKEAFKTKGILGGIKAIGVTILDAILMPLQQVFKLLSNIPGVGKFAQKAVEGIQGLREKLGVNLSTDETGNALSETPAINTEATKQEVLRETITEQRQNVSIDINDKTGAAQVETDNNFVPINLSSTFG